MAPTLSAKNPPEPAKRIASSGPIAKSREVPPERRMKRKRPSPESLDVDTNAHQKSNPPTAPTLSAKNPPEPSKRKRPSAESTPLPFQRTWSPEDEIRILEELAAYRRQHRVLPKTKALFASLDGHLVKKSIGKDKLRVKVNSLKRRYGQDAINGAPSNKHELRLYHLSKNVWGDMPEPIAPAVAARAKSQTQQVPSAGTGRTCDEMLRLYPYLAQEVMHLVDAEAQPAVLERVLLGIDDSNAQALDLKIKRLRKELTKAITESARMQSMEVPKVWQCPSSKLQQAKLRSESENTLLLERLEKIDGASIGTQEQLARMEHQIAELKRIVIASQSSPKAIRCESAESAPHSFVAENQFSRDIMQRKIEAQKRLPHGKNREILERQMLAPINMNIGRREKIDAESGILRVVEKQKKITACAQQGVPHNRKNKGGKEVTLLSFVTNEPVAKATLERSSLVGDMPQGSEYCDVFVTEVLIKTAPLRHSFRNMNIMIDALGCSIAWPRKNIQHDTVSGMVAPDQPSRPGQ